MTYCWVMRFDDKGTIVQVRAYLDTALLKQVLEEHECPSATAGTSVRSNRSKEPQSEGEETGVFLQN